MLKKYLTLFCLLIVVLEATEKQKICLNMIVKNESKVIERCLNSVKPFIDYWVIVDTGSTDGTQDVIKNCMKDIPGELHERKWVNFGHNRNEALELAKPKGDYIFLIDADEYLEYPNDYRLPLLDHNVYVIKCHACGVGFTRVHLVQSTPELHWEGVIHEYLSDPKFESYGLLAGIDNISTTEGARARDPAKLLRDALVLEKELKKDPTNARYRYYLAQSYKAHGDKVMALENYRKRAEMAGGQDEIYESKLQIVLLERDLGISNDDKYRDGLLTLFRNRPTHVEPLYYLSSFYRNKGDYQLAYFFARLGLSSPPNLDVANVAEWISSYGLLFELSIAAYWVGDYEMSYQATKDLLNIPSLPDEYREHTLKNQAFAEAKLYQTRSQTLNLDSARQTPIEAKGSERGDPSLHGKGDEEDRLGKLV